MPSAARGRKLDGARAQAYVRDMDPRHLRAPDSWYDERRPDAPFAAFYTLDPSENPTVRPAVRREPTHDPMEAIVREENLVIVGRRSRPVSL